MRLVIILLVLVVLPTAILSLVAGRSIQSRELILHKRLEQGAVQKIDEIGDEIRLLLEADSEEVILAFKQTVLSGIHIDNLEQRVETLQAKPNFINSMYLFMNPWNFIYPREINPKSDGPVSSVVLFQQELIRQISLGLKREASNVSFVYEGKPYCFKPISNMPELYAGFEIDMEQVALALDSILVEYSTHDVALRIETINGGMKSRLQNDLLITDSFNPQPSAFDHFVPRRGDDKSLLARGQLPAPLLYVEIAAYLVDEDGINKAEALESRLILWGILLLAIVIITSSTILIKKTMNQAIIARRRSEFVIGMSHDLRTPVAAMRVLSDSLSAGRVESPEKQKEFLSRISSECERLGDMIERVLFFFKQEHGAVEYTMQYFDPSMMVKQIVTSVEGRLLGKVKINLDIDNSVPEVLGDVEALGKVITNLIDNALKYGGGDGEKPEGEKVEHRTSNIQHRTSNKDGLKTEKTSRNASHSDAGGLKSEEEGDWGGGTHKGSLYVVRVFSMRWRRRDWVIISVADNGPGIAVSEQKKIFKRFYRVGSDNHSHVGGIGLGLSLCADIVRAHRGRIVVKSEVGKGAEFSVWLRGKG